MGIKMGEPYFQCQERLQWGGATVFSANFPLYGDLSARVVRVIKEVLSDSRARLDERVEVYSIDEVFIDLSAVPLISLEPLAWTLRRAVFQQVGIPVSVGVAPTKTLAKVATALAKRGSGSERVQLILDEPSRLSALRRIEIEDVWGVGQRWAARLKRVGINRALDLADVSSQRLRHAVHSVCLMRTSRELRGESCLPIDLAPPPRRSMMHSRTFSRRITCPRALRDALSAFAEKLSVQLRTHGRQTGVLTLWMSAPFPSPASYPHARRHPNRASARSAPPPRYTIRRALLLSTPCADSTTLISSAMHLLEEALFLAERNAPRQLSRPIGWRKAGLLALDLSDGSQPLLPLDPPDPKKLALAQVADQLNQRFGRGSARIGGTPVKPTPHHRTPALSGSARWRPQSAALSPRYTTCWADLPIVE